VRYHGVHPLLNAVGRGHVDPRPGQLERLGEVAGHDVRLWLGAVEDGGMWACCL
jgi:hypothetical protein